jgi:hypothetical protein
MASFTSQPPYHRGKSLRYPWDRKLSAPQSRSGQFAEEKILGPTGTQTPTYLSSSPQPVAIPTELSQLRLSTQTILKEARETAIVKIY